MTSSLGLRGTSNVESASSVESISGSEPDEDSDYESDSEEDAEPEELSPLPITRPNDPAKAVEYDIVQAVWAKRNVGLSGAVIRTALGDYWTIIKGIREKWKSEMLVLQQAKDKKNQAATVEYERRVTDQRRLLESCIRLTLKHGHEDIVEKYVQSLLLHFLSYLWYPAPYDHCYICTKYAVTPSFLCNLCTEHVYKGNRVQQDGHYSAVVAHQELCISADHIGAGYVVSHMQRDSTKENGIGTVQNKQTCNMLLYRSWC